MFLSHSPFCHFLPLLNSPLSWSLIFFYPPVETNLFFPCYTYKWTIEFCNSESEHENNRAECKKPTHGDVHFWKFKRWCLKSFGISVNQYKNTKHRCSNLQSEKVQLTVAEAAKDVSLFCRGVTHMAWGLVRNRVLTPQLKQANLLVSARLNCFLVEKMCISHMLKKALATITLTVLRIYVSNKYW